MQAWRPYHCRGARRVSVGIEELEILLFWSLKAVEVALSPFVQVFTPAAELIGVVGGEAS